MVLVVDDDAAMRRWKARFARSDYGAASLLRNIVLNTSPNTP
jgi:hypothetical protein